LRSFVYESSVRKRGGELPALSHVELLVSELPRRTRGWRLRFDAGFPQCGCWIGADEDVWIGHPGHGDEITARELVVDLPLAEIDDRWDLYA
jgi:hypothetical protein